MTTKTNTPSSSVDRKTMFLAMGGLLLFFVLALAGIRALIRHEEKRDLDRWRITLEVMADTRARLVQTWLDRQFGFLAELGTNASLQVYTQTVIAAPSQGETVEPAQLSYLRNLLRAEAERGGFVDRSGGEPAIPANVVSSPGAGLSLLAKDGSSLLAAAVAGQTPDTELSRQVATVAANGKPALVDLHLDEKQRAIVGFLVPVFGIASQTGGRETIAVLYGFKDASTELFPLLRSEGMVFSTAETLLVRGEGNLLVYLAPLADGAEPLRRKIANDAGSGLAAPLALASPGGFGQGIDYAGTPVLFVSRSLAGTPWILIQQLSAAEALRESEAHGRFLLTALTLCLAVAGALYGAAWWHGSAARARAQAEALTSTFGELEKKNRIMDAVVDNVHDILFLIDPSNGIIFANRLLAESLQVTASDLRGKTLPAVLGPAVAEKLEPLVGGTAQEGTAKTELLECDLGQGTRSFSATFIPLGLLGESRPVLVSLHDITPIQEARARQEKLLGELISALMRSIDLHDPWSANHSAMVTDISARIASVMGVTQEERKTIALAATLCNVGKLFVPQELLTKSGALSEEEQHIIHTESTFARDALSGIDFGGPVLATILQKNECLDGSGYPNKLKDAEILPPARILAVANVFVALISPRSWRERFSVQEALNQLLSGAGTRYDRGVVAALFHVAENEIDWDVWQKGRLGEQI